MVVGEVGSGKSSLLAAILGELHKASGKVKIAGSITYTAQVMLLLLNQSMRSELLLKPGQASILIIPMLLSRLVSLRPVRLFCRNVVYELNALF